MKTSQNFTLIYVLMAVCQIFLGNYANLGPFVILTMLPAMILCLPSGMSTPVGMGVAFALGLATDYLSDGLLGLNIAALLPVALCRRGVIRLFLGEDIIVRKDNFSIRKNGIAKVSFSLLTLTAIFLAVYIFLDGAGTRPLWFCISRFFASLACNWVLGTIVVHTLTYGNRK